MPSVHHQISDAYHPSFMPTRNARRLRPSRSIAAACAAATPVWRNPNALGSAANAAASPVAPFPAAVTITMTATDWAPVKLAARLGLPMTRDDVGGVVGGPLRRLCYFG